MNKHYIGFKDNTVIDSKETIQQILDIKKYDLDIHDDKGSKLSWDDLDNYEHDDSLFCNIVRDRTLRVNKGYIMADRPPMCVIYTEGTAVVRVEYYEGHDGLEQIYDIRRYDLYNINLEPDLVTDPFYYDNGLSSSGISLLVDIHNSVIERSKDVKARYFGRCTETLIEHNGRFNRALYLMMIERNDISKETKELGDYGSLLSNEKDLLGIDYDRKDNETEIFEVYEVGQKILKYAHGKEGAMFTIDDSSLNLKVFFRRPNEHEIRQFMSTVQCEFKLCEMKGILFILSKFGNLEWMDSPYHPLLRSKLPTMQKVYDGAGYALFISLIDSTTGEIKTIRFLSLNTRISEELRKSVEKLKHEDFNVIDYEKKLEYIYRNYSTKKLLDYSTVRCKVN